MKNNFTRPYSLRRFLNPDGFLTLGNYLMAIIYSLIIAVPFYYLVVSCFKDNSDIYNFPLNLPRLWTLAKFARVQAEVNIFHAVGVSFYVTIGAEAISLVLGFLAAYAIARIPTKITRFIEPIFAAGFLIPSFAIIVPVFLLAVKVGLFNNPLSYIFFLSSSSLPFTVILLTSSLREIPREIEESAEMDGASRADIILKIMVPMTTPGIITIVLINLFGFWNEYLFGWILLGGNLAARTVQMVVPLLRTAKNVDYSLVAAGVVVSVIPMMIVFIFFSEKIMSGISTGAVKG